MSHATSVTAILYESSRSAGPRSCSPGAADGAAHGGYGGPHLRGRASGTIQRQGRRQADGAEDLLSVQGASAIVLLTVFRQSLMPLQAQQPSGQHRCDATCIFQQQFLPLEGHNSGVPCPRQVRCLGGCKRTVQAAPGGAEPALCEICAADEGKAAEVRSCRLCHKHCDPGSGWHLSVAREPPK